MNPIPLGIYRHYIGKCEKAQLKLAEGTPQHTLTKRRLEAFYIAVSLIEKELREES